MRAESVGVPSVERTDGCLPYPTLPCPTQPPPPPHHSAAKHVTSMSLSHNSYIVEGDMYARAMRALGHTEIWGDMGRYVRTCDASVRTHGDDDSVRMKLGQQASLQSSRTYVYTCSLGITSRPRHSSSTSSTVLTRISKYGPRPSP